MQKIVFIEKELPKERIKSSILLQKRMQTLTAFAIITRCAM
jgi:hypothetical protein